MGRLIGQEGGVCLKELAGNKKAEIFIALLFLFLLFASDFAFAGWAAPLQQEAKGIDFGEISAKYGADAAAFAKRIHLRFEKRLLSDDLRGIVKVARQFPEGNGKAVLDSLTDKRYSVWGEFTLREAIALGRNERLVNFFFKGSNFAKIGGKRVDAFARAGSRNFFIETTSLRQRLSSPRALYSKIVRESRRFKDAQHLDITLVIVLIKGTAMRKAEIEKAIWSAYENSSNLDVQNISRVAVYNASSRGGKVVTVYSRQDWVDGKP